jgi:hypothetical protein
MLNKLFSGLDIDTKEIEDAEADEDLVVLLNDGDIVTSSPLSILKETLLMVNSDLYRSGTKEIQDIDPPDIIKELSDTVFTLRGYPESDIEKLVLTLVSRYIEYQAWSQGAGTLRSSFQRLSRLNDERGTRRVYERLGEAAGLDVNVYGVPDWDPPDSMGVTAHGISDDEIMRHWFVVYDSDATRSVAMLAVKTDPHTWEGYWTYDIAEIEAINRYIVENID